MSPRDLAGRTREIAQLRELQRRRAAFHASMQVKERDVARRNESRQLQAVSDLAMEWSRATSASSFDPAQARAWSIVTGHAKHEAQRLSALALDAEDAALKAIDVFAVAQTLAERADGDALDAAIDLRRHVEAKREAMLVELRLARRGGA